jgi:hypothetical protein
MTGLGGLNPSPGALVLGLVQAQVPVVTETEHVSAAAERVEALARGAKEGLPTLDLVVFPEYSLNPESWLDTRLLCDLDGPEIELSGRPVRRSGSRLLLTHGAQPRRRAVQQRRDRERQRRRRARSRAWHWPRDPLAFITTDGMPVDLAPDRHHLVSVELVAFSPQHPVLEQVPGQNHDA